MSRVSNPSRRDFLKTSAAAGGGLLLGVVLPDALAMTGAAAAKTSMPNAWVRIGSDNTITILSARSEMGQGVYTALPTLVAEELEVDLAGSKSRRRRRATLTSTRSSAAHRSPAARRR